MTTQTYPQRIATIAISVMSILLLMVLLLLLLVILWRSKPPSFMERDGCLRDKAITNRLGDDITSNVLKRDLIEKTDTRHYLDKNNNNRAEKLRMTKDFLHKDINGIFESEMMENDETNENERESTCGDWKKEIWANTKGDLEYIRPLKLDRSRPEDAPKKNHSGLFRHDSTKIWDPHPQYVFTAFGRKFLLRLTHDSSFISANIKVTHIKKNSKTVESRNRHLGCFYTGTVDGDPRSIVSVSLCRGVTGHIQISTGNYFIKPVEQRSSDYSSSNGSSLQHAILRVNEHSQKDVKRCHTVNEIAGNNHDYAVIDDRGSIEQMHEEFDETRYTSENQHPHNRQRRDSSKIADSVPSNEKDNAERREYSGSSENITNNHVYKDKDFSQNSTPWRRKRALSSREHLIEILVVADSTMLEYYNRELEQYILFLFNTVSVIFKHPSIGNFINIAVVKITKTDEVFGMKRHRDNDIEGIDVDEMLTEFCQWQNHSRHREPSQHYDVALLLTKETFCQEMISRDNEQSTLRPECNIIGFARLGEICSDWGSCAIVQDTGLSTSFTIAHEIGHLLGLPHDDARGCERFPTSISESNVMFRTLTTYPYEWSKCSEHYLTEFLDADRGHCLLNEPTKILKSSHNWLPGIEYSTNKQCQLAWGQDAEICDMEVCKKLWCSVSVMGGAKQCQSKGHPWADQTPCGNNKWCYRGKCVLQQTLKPIDGQWSEWGHYSECSRTCGGGIQKKVRLCNNPPPKNGGNFCAGEKTEYRSCATQECPSGSPDFREEQCAWENYNNHNFTGVPWSVKWHAKHVLGDDCCRLYCQIEGRTSYHLIKRKVIDGTKCDNDTFNMCVNGRCRPAGCDHTLGSNAEIDACGVCRGDNSTCDRITGSYNISSKYYHKVTTIPAGSNFIDIRQRSLTNMPDSNYLVLRLRNNYILNGDMLVMQPGLIKEPGITIQYSGHEHVVERLNSSRPISVDLIVEVLSINSDSPPQITYDYTVPKKILYEFKWVLANWTECDRTCQGIQYRKAECRSLDANNIVSEHYCRDPNKPQEQTKKCNEYCTLKWQVQSMSECSRHCGPGIRIVNYRCTQIISSSGVERPVANYACEHLRHGSKQQKCMGSCKDARWRYGEWDVCSVTCGGGVQMRSAACIIESSQEIVPDEKCLPEERLDKRACKQIMCPKWDFGDWSECSVTCGIGWKLRKYWCQVDNHVIADNNCKGRPSQMKEVCDAGPCYKWYLGDWSECSATCGEGTRRRKIACNNADGSPSNRCDLNQKPIDVTTCSMAPCPVITTTLPIVDLTSHRNSGDDSNYISTYKHEWHIVNYGKCSKSCGGGLANLEVICISSDTKMPFPSDYCDPNSRPSDVIPCNKHPCPKWDTSAWSQCSVKCGEGYQGRQVRCRSWRGEILNDNECSLEQKPQARQKCRRRNCGVSRPHKWRASNWSDCSVSCGKGVQTRNVTCHRRNPRGWISPMSTLGCSNLDKPRTQRSCKVRDCQGEFYWSTSSWTKCSHPCGKHGKESRRLFCLDSQGKKVPKHNCSKDSRPQKRRKCNQGKCGPTSCLEIKKRFRSNADGEYKLFVGGKNMSIYCHKMHTTDPKEYLTLPEGDKQNYAEIYDKRLRNPQSCPSNGERDDGCHCVSDEGSVSGKTMFKKLRLDVSKLHVIVNDYTFSWTKGANRIEFGKAGDCYSLKNCPQGSFSIDLRGTYLKVALDVTWTTQGRAYRLIERISDQLIVGKCGGYCGFCMLPSGLKLDVLPP